MNDVTTRFEIPNSMAYAAIHTVYFHMDANTIINEQMTNSGDHISYQVDNLCYEFFFAHCMRYAQMTITETDGPTLDLRAWDEDFPTAPSVFTRTGSA